MYSDMLEKRGRNTNVAHYESARYHTPTETELESIDHIAHLWKTGDRLYKLAATHYDDPSSWWIIALYNGTPTEGHITVGDTIYIPTPVGRILSLFGF
jgi:hypothetical protein